eukprot:1179104-Prorocentrum_minimum.AAC.3
MFEPFARHPGFWHQTHAYTRTSTWLVRTSTLLTLSPSGTRGCALAAKNPDTGLTPLSPSRDWGLTPLEPTFRGSNPDPPKPPPAATNPPARAPQAGAGSSTAPPAAADDDRRMASRDASDGPDLSGL